jgi:hypothetical protein
MITTNNYSALANSCTCPLTTAHTKSFQFVFTSRFMVTGSNNVLCLRPYWLANVSQLTKVKVTLRLTVSMSVLVSSPGWGSWPDVCSCLKVTVLYWLNSSQSYVTTDGQPASLSWNKAPIWGLRPDLDYLWQLRVCWFGAPSLTRGRVCRLQLLLVLASAVIFGSYFTVSTQVWKLLSCWLNSKLVQLITQGTDRIETLPLFLLNCYHGNMLVWTSVTQ